MMKVIPPQKNDRPPENPQKNDRPQKNDEGEGWKRPMMKEKDGKGHPQKNDEVRKGVKAWKRPSPEK